MTPVNIFISSSSRKVALVNAFSDALQRLNVPGKVFAADVNPLSATLYGGHATAVLSRRSDDPTYLAWLMEFCLTHQIKVIVPTRDEEIELFARAQDDFNRRGIIVNVSSLQTVGLCRDKAKFNAFCQQQGIDIPKVYSMTDQVPLPCFIKARIGKGGSFAFKVTTLAQLNALRTMTDEVIIQEYVDWPEYTVDFFADFSGQVISVVPRLRISVFGGESFVGKTVNEEAIIDACMRLGHALALKGHNTIQLFFNPQTKQIKFIEINPRFGGAAALSVAAGAHTPMYLVQCALGQTLVTQIGNFKEDLYMLRFTQDVFIEGQHILKP